MSIEKIIAKIKKYIIQKTDLIEDDRKDVNNRKKIVYDDNIVLNKNIIAYKDKNTNYKYRFLLECNLKGGEKNKTALFIMKNPSMADEKWSDSTVNRVLETMHNFQYSKVYIMNLIPEYTPNPKHIHVDSVPDEILKINYKLMKLLSKEVTKVFVAWGNSNGIRINFYNRIINRVKTMLKESIQEDKVYCYCYNRSGQPRHPGRTLWWNTKKKECAYEIWPKK